MQAIVSAAQAIQTGDADVALAGGAESMSRGPDIVALCIGGGQGIPILLENASV